jgi:hypothetical protein
MLFTEAFLNDPARTSASQESNEDLKESVAGSGLKCSELFTISDPLGYWLKMSVEQSIRPSIQCNPAWKMKATKSGASSFLHLRLVRPTKEKGCSLWRTPDANCDRGASSVERMDWKVEKKMPISINDQVAHCGRMWPTPSTMDHIARKGMRPSRAATGRTTGYLSEAILEPNTVKVAEGFGLLLPYAEITTAKGQANGAETD